MRADKKTELSGCNVSVFNSEKMTFAMSDSKNSEQANGNIINLDFKGYCFQYQRYDLPSVSGIYCVYLYMTDAAEKSIIPHKLLYIGYALNVKQQIELHEINNYWEKYLHPGIGICYSYAPVDEKWLQTACDAMIFRHKPPANNNPTECCVNQRTIVFCNGKTPFLYSLFEVGKT
jgi:hypothetical protein